jgi:Mg-chelatase subunit ChlD
VAEGDDAAAAVAEASRRTTARRELSRREHFAQISPDLGELDEAAFDELLSTDPDEALSLLADMNGATDERLRVLARRLAGRIMVDLARQGLTARRSVGRLARRPMDRTVGDIDLDASMDELVAARRGARPAEPAELVAAAWERPDTAVCLLVDRSGSMHGARLATAALAAATVALRAPTSSSVVAFAQDAVVLGSQGVPRDPDAIVSDLLRLRGVGVTDVGLALRTAQAQLARSPAARRLTILLSDCRPTAGGDPIPDARAVDELAILAPEGDSDDARALAEAVGARCTTVGGPASVVDALTVALTP